MCKVNMVFTWYRDGGEPVNQLCRCFNGKVTYAKDFKAEDAYIQHFRCREEAIKAGWKYDKGCGWICPECN